MVPSGDEFPLLARTSPRSQSYGALLSQDAMRRTVGMLRDPEGKGVHGSIFLTTNEGGPEDESWAEDGRVRDAAPTPEAMRRARALRAEEIECPSERARRIRAILLLGNGNEPAPRATEDSDPGTNAQLEGFEIAGQEGEPEQREVRPCFDR